MDLDAELCEVLWIQTLLVLEFGRHPFEDLRDLALIELLKIGATFREAITLLDTVGWLPSPSRTATSRRLSPSVALPGPAPPSEPI